MTALTSGDRETIVRLTEQEWTAAALARDWGRTVAMCADDVVYMPSGYPAVHGHAALRAWMDGFPRILKFTQPIEAVEGLGNLAMSRAVFAVTVEMGGTAVENTGKVLCGWEKDASGRWLVKTVCWNWDRPLV